VCPRRVAADWISSSPVRLTAVVVHYRSAELLLSCLPSLAAFDEVIVVDNASGDGSPELVRDGHPSVRVIQAERNRGFAGGANLGLRASGGDAALLLNPDSIAAPDLAEQLRDALDLRPAMWIGGCRLAGPDGSARENGRRWYTPASVATRRLAPRRPSARRLLISEWDRSTDRPVDWVSGNGMLVRAKAFEALEGFDERYFMYFEDVDICLRAWRAGGEVWFLSGAGIIHDERRASAAGINLALWWHLRAYARFLGKWGVTGLRAPPYGDRMSHRSSILPPS
jgi:N-acetylglucosaminyl-diphospho-decaprenol L-rhamnosyltransferase